jgi:hypothetical protein
MRAGGGVRGVGRDESVDGGQAGGVGAVWRYGGTAVRRYGGMAVRRYGGTAV